jgi:hypothetical protein
MTMNDAIRQRTVVSELAVNTPLMPLLSQMNHSASNALMCFLRDDVEFGASVLALFTTLLGTNVHFKSRCLH